MLLRLQILLVRIQNSDIVKRLEEGSAHINEGTDSIVHLHTDAHTHTVHLLPYTDTHTHFVNCAECLRRRRLLSEVTKGSAGLTRELSGSLSDFTVSAQTEPVHHWGWFSTGTEYLTFKEKKS